jgi:hypothetical protein
VPVGAEPDAETFTVTVTRLVGEVEAAEAVAVVVVVKDPAGATKSKPYCVEAAV